VGDALIRESDLRARVPVKPSCCMLEGKLTRLRKIEPDDLPAVLAWRNSPEVRDYLFATKEISADEHRAWYERLRTDHSKEVFVITDLAGQPLGLAQLFDIDYPNSRAEWGFYISDPRNRRAGYGAEAEYLILRYAFDELKLHRIYCHTLAFNKSVLSLHERFNFKQEGVLRAHIRRDNQPHDVVITAILKEEFAEVREKVEQLLGRIAER